VRLERGECDPDPDPAGRRRAGRKGRGLIDTDDFEAGDVFEVDESFEAGNGIEPDVASEVEAGGEGDNEMVGMGAE
jgi:hypothetical protein